MRPLETVYYEGRHLGESDESKMLQKHYQTLHEAGVCALVQRRVGAVGEGRFQYIAQWRR